MLSDTDVEYSHVETGRKYGWKRPSTVLKIQSRLFACLIDFFLFGIGFLFMFILIVNGVIRLYMVEACNKLLPEGGSFWEDCAFSNRM